MGVFAIDNIIVLVSAVYQNRVGASGRRTSPAKQE
jgi:hypothetical protein